MKTQSRIRLVVGVVSRFILFVSLVSFPLARKGWTTAAMFPDNEDTFEFTNNETEDAYDLHIEWSRAVNVKQVTPFKKKEGSGTNKTDLSNGVVKPTEKASVTVTWDGTAPTVKQWWWTKANGDRLGKVKTGNPTIASAPVTTSSTTRDGLTIVTFDTLQGRVIVNLPDDMRADDTILGTVKAEPKGQTEPERATNMAVLTGCVIEIEPPRKPDGTSNPKVTAQVTAALSPFTFTLPPSSPPTPPLKSVSSGSSGGLGITLTNTSGSFSIGGTTTVPIEIISLSLQSVAPLTVFQLPTIGQQGRPAVISGPFQVNQRSILMYGPPGASVQDFEKNTENVSGGFGLINPIAQSPRKCVFEAPTNVTGPIEIYLKEGNTQTKGTYRNVGVNLTAPKTSLLKGESTELHVQVSGLDGIKEPVPLALEFKGVITPNGYQQLVIQPSEVGADGSYTTTRGITGVQAGGWEATATVVTHRFDVCLQDDTAPARRLLWNTFNGEYIFINPFPPRPPGQPTQTGSTTPTTGTGKIEMKGCIFTLEHNVTDRRVMGTIDQCTHSGSASVQTVSPKIKFTIIDRQTANNTCAVP